MEGGMDGQLDLALLTIHDKTDANKVNTARQPQTHTRTHPTHIYIINISKKACVPGAIGPDDGGEVLEGAHHLLYSSVCVL